MAVKQDNQVGEVSLGLTLNSAPVEQQAKSLQGSLEKRFTNMAGKISAAIGAAFAVKKIIDFGDACIYAGRKLNAMTSMSRKVFPQMQSEMQNWAKNAADNFGLSQKQALQFTSTMGSMAKSFGFSEKQAAGMATTLAGLAGDMASFYSGDQDEMFQKLQSVFTGETESLKSLGIVMSQTALNEFAMANGWSQNVQNMTEAEKVALRYQFILDKTKQASGDFIDTQAAWGNQIKILKLRFEELKAAIGQGLINILAPVLKMINIVMSGLVKLAQAFKAFTELITGKKSAPATIATDAADAGIALDDASDSADNLADATDGVGSAAKKAAKEMRGLMGFDKIQKLQESTSDTSASPSGSKAGGVGSGLGAAAGMDFGSLAKGDTVLDDMNKKAEWLRKKIQEVWNIFKAGFWKVAWDVDTSKVLKSVEGIKTSLRKIFTSKEVTESIKKLGNSIVYNLGRSIGSTYSVGVSIASNILGGLDKCLSENAPMVSSRIAGIFESFSDIFDLAGDLSEAVAEIFKAFGSEEGKTVTSNFFGIILSGFLGGIALATKFAKDVISVVVKPIQENATKIRAAIEETLGVVGKHLETAKGVVDNTVGALLKMYDEHISPLFESLKTGISSLIGQAVDAYETHILPVIKNLEAKWEECVSKHLQPMIDNLVGLIGDIADTVKTLWEKWLQPFASWVISTVTPILAPIFEKFGSVAIGIFGGICDAISTAISDFRSILNFLQNIFKGDWDAVFEDVKNAFGQDCFDKFAGIINTVKGALNTFRTFLKKTFFRDWSKTWNDIKDKFKTVWDSFEGIVKAPINGIIGMINSLIGAVEWMVNSVARAFNSISISIPDWVPGIGGNTLGFNIPEWEFDRIPELAEGGIAKKNTPRLAVIGDNRTQDEIVAPEDKLRAMANEAAGMGNQKAVQLLKQLVDLMSGLPIVQLDPETVRKYFIETTNKRTAMTGRCELQI